MPIMPKKGELSLFQPHDGKNDEANLLLRRSTLEGPGRYGGFLCSLDRATVCYSPKSDGFYDILQAPYQTSFRIHDQDWMSDDNRPLRRFP